MKTEGLAKTEGLTLEELEAEVGGLLPARVEMRRRRRRRRRRCTSLVLGCGSTVGIDIL